MASIRNHKGRFVSAKVMTERVDSLRSAGFPLSYAHRDDVSGADRLSTSYLTGEYYLGHRSHTITGEAHPYHGQPYVSFDGIARGEDSYGQAGCIVRSNYRSIKRDFPQVPWVDTSYMNTDALGIFVADLDDDLMGMLIGLVEQYPLYDEGDHSELEQEEIYESWGSYLSGDVWRELSEPCRTMWGALGDQGVTDLWWACVSGDVFGSYPEHRGVEVAWGDVKRRASDFRPYLIHAYVSQVRQASSLPDEWTLVRLVSKFRHFKEGK